MVYSVVVCKVVSVLSSFFFSILNGRRIRYAPRQTVGIYKAVLTYQPNHSEICLNTMREEFFGPIKNILMS